MRSVWFTLGKLTIHWYGVLMAAGFMAGLANWVLLGRQSPRDRRNFNFCSDLLFWIMVSGILGARLVFVASDWGFYSRNPLAILRLDQGGLVFYGGFLAAGAALAVFGRTRRVPFVPLMDFVITSVPVAHMFGRIGCFLNGCCYGSRWDGPLAVAYPGPGPRWPASLVWQDHLQAGWIERTATHSCAVHPVQLYEAALNLVLFLVLRRVYLRRSWDGQVTALYLAAYACIRFVLEGFRGDRPHRYHWAGLSSAQWVSVALMAVAAGMALAWRKRRRAPSDWGQAG